MGIPSTDNAGIVAQARRFADECERREVEELLAHPALLNRYGPPRVKQLRRAGEATVKRLKEIQGEMGRKFQERTGAILALIELGEEGAAESFEGLLESVTEAKEASTILSAAEIHLQFSTTTQGEKVRRSAVLMRWLLRWAEEEITRNQVANWRSTLQIPMPTTFSDIDPAKLTSSHSVFMEVRRRPTTGLLKEVVRRLQSGEMGQDAGWLWQALGEFPPGQDRGVVAALFPTAIKLLSKPGISVSSEEWGALAFLERQSADREKILTELAKSAPNAGVRIHALPALCKIAPKNARRIALQMLAGEGSMSEVGAAARVLGELGAGTEDREVVYQLTGVGLKGAKNSVARALLRVGGPAALRGAERLLPRVDMSTATAIRETCGGMTRDVVVRQFVDAGVFTADQVERGLALVKKSEGERESGDWSRAFLTGTGLYFVFDTESADVPPRYDDLLFDFAEHSGGVFEPEAVAQEPTDYGELSSKALAVQFIHRGRLYRFSPAFNGDWIDVPAIAETVNRALAESGAAQRFLSFRSEGQCVDFVCVPAKAFVEVAKRIGWAISSDLAEAAKAGAAFEEHVREMLEER